jgi:hypothetical protein
MKIIRHFDVPASEKTRLFLAFGQNRIAVNSR